MNALKRYLETKAVALQVKPKVHRIIRAPRNNPATYDVDKVVNDWLAINDPAGDTQYMNTNVCDPDFDITGAVEFLDAPNFDEFDEYSDLSVVEFDSARSAKAWLNGYRLK